MIGACSVSRTVVFKHRNDYDGVLLFRGLPGHWWRQASKDEIAHWYSGSSNKKTSEPQAITAGSAPTLWGGGGGMEVGVEIRAVLTGQLPPVLDLKDGEEMLKAQGKYTKAVSTNEHRCLRQQTLVLWSEECKGKAGLEV